MGLFLIGASNKYTAAFTPGLVAANGRGKKNVFLLFFQLFFFWNKVLFVFKHIRYNILYIYLYLTFRRYILTYRLFTKMNHDEI